MLTHTRVRPGEDSFVREAWVSHDAPERLLIFIHGFGGRATSTWGELARFDPSDPFWVRADMLFVGYASFHDSIIGVADRLRRNISSYYPVPHRSLYENEGGLLRDTPNARYSELIIIGHSLGGLVARRAVLDAYLEGLGPPGGPRPVRSPILDARLRLFSPASAGFRPTGLLGMLRTSYAWSLINFALAATSSFVDLKPGSQVLESTRFRTEKWSQDEGADSLRARLVWANPDEVVINDRYESDTYSQSIDRQTHRSVCKPHSQFVEPWSFIAKGTV